MLRYVTSMGHNAPKDVSFHLRWVCMMVHIREECVPTSLWSWRVVRDIWLGSHEYFCSFCHVHVCFLTSGWISRWSRESEIAIWRRAGVVRALCRNSYIIRLMHACPPHVARMMQCMVLTRVYALSNRYTVTLVT